MENIIYHNLNTVSQIYNATFKIRFPSCEKIKKAIKLRHDIVHRNGKKLMVIFDCKQKGYRTSFR